MNKISPRILTFAGGESNIKPYEMFKDYYHHYMAAVRGKKNVEYKKVNAEGKEISFAEKEAQMNEVLINEIKRVAHIGDMSDFTVETYANHPTFKWATFAVVDKMIDMVLPETIIDTIGIYTDVANIDMGDSAAFDVTPRDLFVVTKAGHGKRLSEIHKQFKGQVTLIPEEHDITVGVSLYRVLAGKESLAEFTMKAMQSLESQMTLDAYNAFNTAMTNLPTTPVGGELKLAGFTQVGATQLAERVTTFNQGAKAVFVGTPVAVRNILPDDANYRYDIESDYVKIGYVRTAFGYDVMPISQVADWANPFKTLLDDTRIYVLSPSSQKLIKLAIEGSTLAVTSDVFGDANLNQTTNLKKFWAAGVATNATAGMITLS